MNHPPPQTPQETHEKGRLHKEVVKLEASHPGLYDALFRAHTANPSDKRIKNIYRIVRAGIDLSYAQLRAAIIDSGWETK